MRVNVLGWGRSVRVGLLVLAAGSVRGRVQGVRCYVMLCCISLGSLGASEGAHRRMGLVMSVAGAWSVRRVVGVVIVNVVLLVHWWSGCWSVVAVAGQRLVYGPVVIVGVWCC